MVKTAKTVYTSALYLSLLLFQGEPGANATKGPFDVEGAKKEFEKKFKDKTRNDWSARENFQVVKGKYTLLEMDSADETDNVAMEREVNM